MTIDQTFISELATKAPTPGGGGASAYCGALASALASMVGNLTVGKKKYASVETEVEQALEELADLREGLIALIDADAQAFEPLAASWKMPASTPREQEIKRRATQAALVDACAVPLEIMGACAKVIVLCEFMAHNGSVMALSDAGVAALFAQAALEGASLNIIINAQSLEDEAIATDFMTKQRVLIETYGNKARETYLFVRAQLAQ
ncbi:MAG: cyclodeaminase/cyclohydrolase family protein [Eggerthellaceae bacterium]|nr:cyclodeaminase/cyclohydrolase family protein [Eggerthellaceae bacterium]